MTKMQVLAVTSPLPQEGKTGTLSNLASAFAQAGKSVVIIDADVRKPRLHKIFRIQNLNGLTKYLTTDLPPGRPAAGDADPVAFPDQRRARPAQSRRAPGFREDGRPDRPAQGDL